MTWIRTQLQGGVGSCRRKFALQGLTSSRFVIKFRPPCLISYEIGKSISNSSCLHNHTCNSNQVHVRHVSAFQADLACCQTERKSSRDPEKNSTFLGLGTYCIPTAPGHSRLITRFPFRFPNQIVANIVRMQPRWMTHLSQNQVIDSDNVFLSLLESKVLLLRSSLQLLLLIHIAAT